MKRIRPSLDLAIMVLGVGMVLYHLIYTRVMFQAPIEHQNTHLMFALLLIFLGVLKKNKKSWPWIIPLILLSLVTTGYIKYFYYDLEMRIGIPTQPDVIIGVLLVVVCFIGTIYAFGKILPIVCSLFIAYTLFGQYLPPPLWHFPISLDAIIAMYDMGFKGMFGVALGVSANYVFLFIIFGTLLQASGATRFFIEVARLFSRRLAGGAGMTAVISSAMVSTVTGMGSVNVAITGPFTIPVMKSVGYTAEQAGGIETAASAAGAITPPIMGIAAFVLAEYMGVPYIQVCAMAIMPCLLYYFCLSLFVQLNALKMGIKPIGGEVDRRAIINTAPLFIIPLFAIVVLLMQGFSIMFTGFCAVLVLIFLSFLRKETRMSFNTLVKGLVDGANLGAKIAATCTLVGIMIVSVNMTGIGLLFPAMIEELSGGILPIALLLIALITIILGCGIPPFASYLVVATLCVPALTRMGVPFIPSHFFIFFFAVFALITPPVALTAVMAAPIAGADYMKTSFQAVRAAIIAWFLPFLVLLSPGIILQPQAPLEMVTKLIAALGLVLMLQTALVGYYFTRLSPGERGISAVSAAALVAFIATGNYLLMATGLIIGILLTLWQLRKRRVLKAGSEASSSQ